MCPTYIPKLHLVAYVLVPVPGPRIGNRFVELKLSSPRLKAVLQALAPITLLKLFAIKDELLSGPYGG